MCRKNFDWHDCIICPEYPPLEYNTTKKLIALTRFFKSSVRLTPEEILEAVIIDMEANIAVTRHELEVLKKALASIESDPYYRPVKERSPFLLEGTPFYCG